MSRRSDIASVIAGLEQLRGGNYAHRIAVQGSGQVAELAQAVNLLAESVQDERALESRRDEAHKQLISNLSHDLRTPITSIAGYVDALQRGIGEDPERHLETLASKSAELTRLADDLFYLTKLDSGDLTLEAVLVDVGEVARQTVLGFERELASRGVAVSADIPESRCLVTADPTALQRVLGNFIANSLKHARGMKHFGISVDRQDAACVVTVWDDGSGFGTGVEELLERGASVGPGGGSGLGLSIAHDLVQRMGGRIEAKSEPGVRTAVGVALKLVDEPNGAVG